MFYISCNPKNQQKLPRIFPTMIMEFGNPLLMEWIPGDLESWSLTWDPNQSLQQQEGEKTCIPNERQPIWNWGHQKIAHQFLKHLPLKLDSRILHFHSTRETSERAPTPKKQNCGRLDPPQKVTKYITTLCDFGDLGILGDSQLLGIQRKLNPCFAQGSFSWVLWHQLKHQLKKGKPFKLIIDLCHLWSTQKKKDGNSMTPLLKQYSWFTKNPASRISRIYQTHGI